MKVFLSWSGKPSHQVACAFREWLPSVIQLVVPYVSSEDIDKGTRWSTDIAKELEQANYGIICVTKENLNAPWVHFEAGALSKIIDKSNVTPFLFDLKRSEVQGPLLQFQSAIFEKDDVGKLVESINKRIAENSRLKPEQLQRAFEVWWPQLYAVLNELQQSADVPQEPSDATPPGKPEILEEILELVRLQQKLLNDPQSLLPQSYLQAAVRESRSLRGDATYNRMHDSVVELERSLKRLLPEHPELTDLAALAATIHEQLHDLVGDRRERMNERRRRERFMRRSREMERKLVNEAGAEPSKDDSK